MAQCNVDSAGMSVDHSILQNELVEVEAILKLFESNYSVPTFDPVPHLLRFEKVYRY